MSTILNNETETEKKNNKKKTILAVIVALIIVGVIAAIVIISVNSTKKVETPTFTSQYADVKEGAMVAEIVIKNYGSVKIQLFEDKAPKACENFITHAKNGYYDGLKFHRVIEDFMIQGGDPEGTGSGGESIWGEDFEDEITKDLMPIRGALCMANAGADTNGSQFFIVQKDDYRIQDVMTLRKSGVDSELINHFKEVGGCGWLWNAHTVFGQVFEGMDVVDKVAKIETDSNDMPNEDVVIETIKIYQYEE